MGPSRGLRSRISVSDDGLVARAGYRKAMLQLPSISGLGAQSWRILYVH